MGLLLRRRSGQDVCQRRKNRLESASQLEQLEAPLLEPLGGPPEEGKTEWMGEWNESPLEDPSWDPQGLLSERDLT